MEGITGMLYSVKYLSIFTVSVGDTIETTGYSAIFPEGLTVGTISDFEKRGGDFYKINVAYLLILRSFILWM